MEIKVRNEENSKVSNYRILSEKYLEALTVIFA